MLALALGLVGAACGDAGPASTGAAPAVPFDELVRSPGSFDGARVRLTARWYRSAERSVLTGRLAERIPPEPVGSQIWADAEVSGECVFSDAGVTWGRVVAEGTFRYEEKGAFGRFGVYEMMLDDARLACP